MGKKLGGWPPFGPRQPRRESERMRGAPPLWPSSIPHPHCNVGTMAMACPQNETTTLNMQMRPNLACFLWEHLPHDQDSEHLFDIGCCKLCEGWKNKVILILQLPYLIIFQQEVAKPNVGGRKPNSQQSGAWRRQLQLGGSPPRKI